MTDVTLSAHKVVCVVLHASKVMFSSCTERMHPGTLSREGFVLSAFLFGSFFVNISVFKKWSAKLTNSPNLYPCFVSRFSSPFPLIKIQPRRIREFSWKRRKKTEEECWWL